jgi:hypothetical protein
MTTNNILGALAIALTFAVAASAAIGAPPPPNRGEARAYWVAGKRAQGEDRRRHFAAGMASARALIQANPDDPEGLLWLAANLGSEALERGKLSALRVIREMERLLLRLEERHPTYDHAAAARMLAVLYHKAPPIISIGSNARAREWFERALQRAGKHLANLILAADFFDDVGEDERARQLARAYLAAPASEVNPDAAEWRRIAERIVGSDR